MKLYLGLLLLGLLLLYACVQPIWWECVGTWLAEMKGINLHSLPQVVVTLFLAFLFSGIVCALPPDPWICAYLIGGLIFFGLFYCLLWVKKKGNEQKDKEE